MAVVGDGSDLLQLFFAHWGGGGGGGGGGRGSNAAKSKQVISWCSSQATRHNAHQLVEVHIQYVGMHAATPHRSSILSSTVYQGKCGGPECSGAGSPCSACSVLMFSLVCPQCVVNTSNFDQA